MGSCSTKVDLGIETKTFYDIKNAYLFFEKIFNKMDLKQLKIEYRFLYYIGDISFSSDSYVEFCNEAFGQIIDFISLTISVYDERNDICFLTIQPKSILNNGKNIYISCESKKQIDEILDLINKIKNDEALSTTVINNNYYDNKIEIKENATLNGSIIGGENNSVVNDKIINSKNNTFSGENIIVGDSNTVNEKSKKSFWASIWENLVSNWIWWVLSIAWIVIIAVIKIISGK